MRCDEMCAVIPMSTLEIMDDPFLEVEKKQPETVEATETSNFTAHQCLSHREVRSVVR